MKEFAITIVVIISMFGFIIVDAKCSITNSSAKCDSLDIPKQVYQNVNSLEIRGGVKEMYLPQYLFRFATINKLIIKKCDIWRIRDNTFVDLIANYIALTENGIEAILPGAFKNLTKLEKLILRRNKLKVIQAGVFTGLPISALTLSFNLITTIEDSALMGMPTLNKLHLDNNKLTSIFIPKILEYPEQLEILWVYSNSLKTLTNYMLKGLTNLTILNAAFNEIETFEGGVFEQTPKLQTLVLSNNKIKQIDGSIFPREGLQNLVNLYLDNNELMFLPSNFFFRLDFLKKITLVGNPWLCPCLDVISRILYDNNIQEKCQFEYDGGGKPVCISDPSTSTCSYIYHSELSDRYLQIKNSAVDKKHLCFL